MQIEQLREQLGEFARDIKLNLGTVLTSEGAPGLTEQQIYGVALTAAYTTGSTTLIQALEADAASKLSDSERQAAKAASVIMAMNNVYYRYVHFTDDEALGKLPARLRMNVIGKPGIEKLDFELYSLAASAINACENCVKAHVREAFKGGISHEGVQSVGRIAAVINATARALALT